VRLERYIEKIHLVGTRTQHLPACSIVPQPTSLPRATHNQFLYKIIAPICGCNKCIRPQNDQMYSRTAICTIAALKMNRLRIQEKMCMFINIYNFSFDHKLLKYMPANCEISLTCFFFFFLPFVYAKCSVVTLVIKEKWQTIFLSSGYRMQFLWG
jgi:hypothetical protein